MKAQIGAVLVVTTLLFAANNRASDNSSSPLPFRETISINDSGATSDFLLGDKKGFFVVSSFGADFVDETEQAVFHDDGSWNLQAGSPQIGYLPAIKAEFGVSGFDPISGDHFGETKNHNSALALTGTTDFGSYGASFLSVGHEFSPDKDRKDDKEKKKSRGKDTTSVWFSRSFGDFYIKPYVEIVEDNHSRRADKSGTRKELLGASAGYTLSNWPYVGVYLGYAEGTQEKKNKSSEYSSRGEIESFSGSFSASHDGWSADFSVIKTAPLTDELQMEQPTTLWSGLDLSFYSADGSFSFSPGYSYSDDEYQQYGVSTITQSAYFSLDYTLPGDGFMASASGYFSDSANPAWYYDSSYAYASVGVTGPLEFFGLKNSHFSLDLAYDEYDDKIYSSGNYSEFSVIFSLRLLSIDGLLSSRSPVIDHPRLKR